MTSLGFGLGTFGAVLIGMSSGWAVITFGVIVNLTGAVICARASA